VILLDRHSIPSGTLQSWPLGSPPTLHRAAALLISVSDNTEADLLLRTLGRENVEWMMATIGVAAAPRGRPLLTTLELAALKAGPAPRLDAWLQADEAGRRAMLAGELARADAAQLDLARFAGDRIRIDALEWFASAADMVRAMDWLRRQGDETSRAILAVNSGLGPQAAGFAYVGYKGGSEPGVLSLTWLVRSRAGS
jgi:beta-lactamase class A